MGRSAPMLPTGMRTPRPTVGSALKRRFCPKKPWPGAFASTDPFQDLRRTPLLQADLHRPLLEVAPVRTIALSGTDVVRMGLPMRIVNVAYIPACRS
jgi:hypothetical protein